MAVLTVNDLYIKEIDRHITCEFQEGITYLKGKNGSGKTLFLDYLSGLRGNQGIDNNIYMRQNFTFYNRLTVQEYIHFIQDLSGNSRQHFVDFLQSYYPEMDFERYKKKRLGMLSGGEKRLIYVLSILSIKRDWYILDEPFANIDQETKEDLLTIITAIRQNQKANFILTSHEPMDFNQLHTLDFNALLKA